MGALLASVQAFVAACRAPAALEFGEELIPLKEGEYAFEIRSGKLWLDLWHGQRSISRRLLNIEQQTPGVLECSIHRFGGAPGKLTLLDTERPQTAHKKTAGERQSFGGQFRRMLFRQFPGWEIKSVSAAMDLQRSFSAVFPRARLVRGQQQIAAIATPSLEREPELLTFALLWFDYLALRAKDASTQLCVFLPEDAGALTAHRLHWLNGDRLRPRLFRFNEHGMAGEVDPADLGNVDTRVSQRFCKSHLPDGLRAVLGQMLLVEGVAVCPEISGEVSIRCRGVEFARWNGSAAVLGIEDKRTLHEHEWSQITQFAAALQDLRMPRGDGPSSGERWLEGVVRANIAKIEPALQAEPVHSQVLTFAGRERDLLDLLAVSRNGRLAVLELKATEDIHLPMQALDYWTRVHWHRERGEIAHLFPGVQLTGERPLLRLVAPALAFHSTHSAILRYFSPEVDVERIGVNSDWGKQFKVVLRLPGGDDPQSQGGSHEFGRLAGNSQSHCQPEPRACAGTE